MSGMNSPETMRSLTVAQLTQVCTCSMCTSLPYGHLWPASHVARVPVTLRPAHACVWLRTPCWWTRTPVERTQAQNAAQPGSADLFVDNRPIKNVRPVFNLLRTRSLAAYYARTRLHVGKALPVKPSQK